MAVIKHGPAPEDHFSLIANDFARDPRISLRTKGVYLYLRSHRDGWSMSVDRIAEALEVSRRTVTSAVTELEEHGYLVREQTTGERGRFGASNYMVLSQPLVNSPSAENLRTVPPAEMQEKPTSTPQAKNAHTVPPAETPIDAGRTVRKNSVNGEFAQHKKTNSSKKTKDQENQENTNAVPASTPKRQSYPPDFNEFWNALPSEKKNGKKNAYAQWKKAIRVIPKDELLRILEQHIAYHQAKDGHCQYLQDPERWLRNQRWEDELAPLRQQSTPGRAKSAAEINAERRGQLAPQFAINGLPVIDGYIEPQPQITR